MHRPLVCIESMTDLIQQVCVAVLVAAVDGVNHKVGQL